MSFSVSALLLVIGFSPIGSGYGLGGPFNKSLTEEGWCSIAPVDPTFFTATFGDGCDASVHLQFVSLEIAVAIFAEGDEQSWRQFYEALSLFFKAE